MSLVVSLLLTLMKTASKPFWFATSSSRGKKSKKCPMTRKEGKIYINTIGTARQIIHRASGCSSIMFPRDPPWMDGSEIKKKSEQNPHAQLQGGGLLKATLPPTLEDADIKFNCKVDYSSAVYIAESA